MKIVVIGGTGLIGSKTVQRLRNKGHEVVAGSPDTGINTLTGEGVAEALKGASVVVDLANSSAFDEGTARNFFETAGRNLLAAEKFAGTQHHIALSVVGTERMQNIGYFRAKMVQENLVRASSIPYTIIHSTQFFEFVGAIANSAAVGRIVRLPPAMIQPISSNDVADAVTDAALSAPVNGTIEIAGPDRLRMSDGVERFLKATKDGREVVADHQALYFGGQIDDRSLVPAGSNPRIGATHFDEWLRQAAAQSK